MKGLDRDLDRTVVNLEDVSLGFGGRPLLENLCLRIPAGELLIILGPSGSGKTTLLRAISGLITPQQGTLQIQAQRVGMVFQDQRLLPWRTARENVALGCMAYVNDRKQRQQRAIQLLDRCGFPLQASDQYPYQLSGGMGARVGIARALALEPDLLLMDEPFNGLDIRLRLTMQDLVRDLVDNEAITVVFVTHDMTEALRLADRILIMSRGRLITRPGLTLPYPQRKPQRLHQAVAELLQDPAIACAMVL